LGKFKDEFPTTKEGKTSYQYMSANTYFKGRIPKFAQPQYPVNFLVYSAKLKMKGY
jgi:hypothetical protein